MHPPDLLRVVEKGATLRRHRFLRDLRVVEGPIAIAILAQLLVYAFVIVQAGREDWSNFAIVGAVLSVVPLATAILLILLRRQEFPITTATFATVIVFNFAVAVLSAMRVPLSYTGLILVAPLVILAMIYANLRFRQIRRDRVAILDFPGAAKLREQLGGKGIQVIDTPFADIGDVDRVLIDGETHHNAEWSRFLVRLYMLGVEVVPWIRFLETRFGRVDVGNFDILHLAFSPSQIYYSKAKRVFDVGAVIVALPVALPLCGLIWLYIWALDGRPVVFKQKRRAYGGGTFTLYKFRTMYRHSDSRATQANDQRVIRGCRFLRLWRLDELPQLLNILRGEMSWIGPRPVAVPIAEVCEAMLPQYAHRHLVLPGLTGWAQVSHKYASNPEEELEKLAYDLFYIKEMSFDLDLLILAKTIRIVLLRVGAL